MPLNEFERMPFHKLVGLPLTERTDEEIRDIIKVLNADSNCAPARRAKVKRESKKLEGKAPVDISLEDLLG